MQLRSTNEAYRALPAGPEEEANGHDNVEKAMVREVNILQRVNVEGDAFNLIFGGVIVLNAVVLGLETDLGNVHFKILEHVFNAVFLLEVGLRIASQGGKRYLEERWNWFDATVVGVSTVDLWVLPCIVHSDWFGSHVSLMRIVRLVRVFRLFRIFRLFRKLVLILQAFGKAFQVVALFAAIVVIIDFILAILLTQGFGHNAKERFGEELGAQMDQWFGTIGASMQTLAVVMTLSSWDNVALSLIQGGVPAPLVCIAFVGYISVTWYTSLSLILGITTNSLTSSRCEFQIDKEDEQDASRKALTQDLNDFLLELFEDEQDGQGRVPTIDFKQAVKSDTSLPDKLTKIGVTLDEKGIIRLIDKLSSEGRVNVQYFIDKVTNLNRVASAASVVDLKYDVIRAQARLASISRLVDAVAERYDVIRGVVSEELMVKAREDKRKEEEEMGKFDENNVKAGSSLKGGNPDRDKTNLKVRISEEPPFFIEPLKLSV